MASSYSLAPQWGSSREAAWLVARTSGRCILQTVTSRTTWMARPPAIWPRTGAHRIAGDEANNELNNRITF